MAFTAHADVIENITAYFETNFTDKQIAYPDLSYEPETPAVQFVRLSIEPDDENSRKLITGDRETGVAKTGIIHVSIFTPKGEGALDAAIIADLVWDVIHEKHIPVAGKNDIVTERTRTVKGEPDDTYNLLVVMADYEFLT